MITFSIGLLVGIILVIIALNLLVTNDPTGCIVFFGLIFLVFLYFVIITVKFIGGS